MPGGLRWISLCAIGMAGCIGAPQHPAATQPSTIADVATTQPSYWYDLPPSATISADNLDAIVDACRHVIRTFGFTVDRVDYRSAQVTSQPLVSSQFFEVWKNDVASVKDSQQASMRTTRRTIRFDIKADAQGRFQVTPRVLVERQSVAEQRVTSVALYRGALARTARQERQRGTPESDEGLNIPAHYWYATGRDDALEKKLVDALERELARSSH
jgi:hypothetical protein